MNVKQGNFQRIHPVIETPLGRMIRERRLAMGLSQSQLAERLDFDSSFVSRLESGQKSLHQRQIPILVEVMGLDRYDLALAIAGFNPATARAQIVRQAHSATLDTVITTLTALRDAPGQRVEGIADAA